MCTGRCCNLAVRNSAHIAQLSNTPQMLGRTSLKHYCQADTRSVYFLVGTLECQRLFFW
jgi:hypothetical protein